MPVSESGGGPDLPGGIILEFERHAEQLDPVGNHLDHLAEPVFGPRLGTSEKSERLLETRILPADELRMAAYLQTGDIVQHL